MPSKEDKKKRQELIKAAEQKQYAKDVSKMPISTVDLKALLEFLERADLLDSDHTLKETVKFLDKHNLDKSKIIPWLNEYGGYSDFEVAIKVGDAWDENIGVNWDKDDVQEVANNKKEQKKEILSLNFGLKLPIIPKEWNLFFVEAAEDSYWYLKFGKKGSPRLTIIETALPEGDHDSDAFWIQQWTQLTNLPLKKPCIVEKNLEALSNATFNSVTVTNTDWTPVYRWIYNADHRNWYMLAQTDVRRKQNDFRELSNLLGKMELR